MPSGPYQPPIWQKGQKLAKTIGSLPQIHDNIMKIRGYNNIFGRFIIFRRKQFFHSGNRAHNSAHQFGCRRQLSLFQDLTSNPRRRVPCTLPRLPDLNGHKNVANHLAPNCWKVSFVEPYVKSIELGFDAPKIVHIDRDLHNI